ncbi:winged helix-turn-helix transcriptional regulator [Enterococcus faecium]|nr:winged helix-turn-helix transcriptional regulator [Enterococcus faecium]
MIRHDRLKTELESLSGFLAALGDAKRQLILIRLLNEKSCHGLQVGELTDDTGLPRPAVSHHLKILKDADLLEVREEGTKNFYYLKHENKNIYKLRDFLNDVITEIEELKDSEENSDR